MKYYQKLTLLLCLMWGFLGTQRIIISIVMPWIQEDLKLTYTQVGYVVAVTGLVWALSTIAWAAVGDRYGRRPVLVFCTLFAAFFSWVTGLVQNVTQMLTVRGSLGFFEGGPYPVAMGVLSEEVPEHRRAMCAGLVTGSYMLVGIGVGSQIAVYLLERFGSWRPVFYVISIPAVVIAIILHFVMHESPSVAEAIKRRKEGKAANKEKDADRTRLRDVIKYKNVLLSSISCIPVMGWLYMFTAFASLFLTRVHNFSVGWIGLIISASGVGGFLGEYLIGALSDAIGRKRTLVLTSLLCAGFGIAVSSLPIGSSAAFFGVLFFLWGFFGAGMYPIVLGTLPAESVPAEIAGTAVSLPVSIGEILGAALMPTLAGMLSDKFNLFAPMWMASLCGLVVAILSVFYVETAPRRLAKMEHRPTREDHLLWS
ncbi:MAG: MFS transporter [Acidobacteriota bacterium]|nr:MFS transporter [Acidobacteriota bacterium]